MCGGDIMLKYIVYKHTFPNHKVYIGITSQQNPYVRWGKSGGGYRNHYPIWYAIQKYGWNNILHEIIFDDLTEDDAKKKEVELIKFYNSTDYKYGYNISPGGDSVSELTRLKLSKIHKGHSTSKETRQKIGIANSKALKGRKLSEEVKQKQRESHLNKKYTPMSEQGKYNISISKRDKKLTDEHKRKISDGNKGKIISEQQRLAASQRMTGTHLSEDTKKKLSNILKVSGKERSAKRMETMKKRYPDGYKMSDTAKQKLSESLKGRSKSEETKQKMRKPKSPEAIANMKRAQKLCAEAKKLGLTYKEYLEKIGGNN